MADQPNDSDAHAIATLVAMLVLALKAADELELHLVGAYISQALDEGQRAEFKAKSIETR